MTTHPTWSTICSVLKFQENWRTWLTIPQKFRPTRNHLRPQKSAASLISGLRMAMMMVSVWTSHVAWPGCSKRNADVSSVGARCHDIDYSGNVDYIDGLRTFYQLTCIRKRNQNRPLAYHDQNDGSKVDSVDLFCIVCGGAGCRTAIFAAFNLHSRCSFLQTLLEIVHFLRSHGEYNTILSPQELGGDIRLSIADRLSSKSK